MNSFFNFSNAKNNEEYKAVVKKKMHVATILAVLGIITLALSYIGSAQLNNHIFSYYSGLGCGLIAGAAVIWIKYKTLLSNEEKLKADRLKSSDERIQQISSKAFRMASLVLIIGIYLFCLIGGLFYPQYFPALAIISFTGCCLFFLTYIIFYKRYEKNM